MKKQNLIRCTGPCERWVKTTTRGLCPECAIKAENQAMLDARKAFPEGRTPEERERVLRERANSTGFGAEPRVKKASS
jgi:hypothetical protein